MVQIKINTPKVRSDEALAKIMQLLHYMERIGKLKHCIMLPMGIDANQRKAVEKLWQPWTSEEREYFRGLRTIFAHADYKILANGSLRVRDTYHRRPGKPEIDGLHFDNTMSKWEWTSEELQRLSERLEKLVLNRFQCYFRVTVTCGTCGQSVDGFDYLTCDHVEYPEGPKGTGFSKPKGATLETIFTIGYGDDLKLEDADRKAVITYDGLDRIISDLETTDKIASHLERKGTPAYIVEPDS